MERAGRVTGTGTTNPTDEAVVLEQIRTAIAGIDFGSVLIKIHDSEVVGIETSTKVKLKGSKSGRAHGPATDNQAFRSTGQPETRETPAAAGRIERRDN